MEEENPSTNINSDENRNNLPQSLESSFTNIFRRAPIFGSLITISDLNTSVNNGEREEGGFGENISLGRPNFRIISSSYSPNSVRRQELAPQPTINSDEIRETIAQNILEVQNIIDFGNYNEFNEENEEKEEEEEKIEKEKKEEYNMNCFDLNKRILAKGQWVDVKDTVDQWLDAQVIEVSEDNKMVKIHYNHWSTRWDEWIETNSPRIMPFRYHTRQTTLTHYLSPYPNKKPDIGVTLLSFENLNRSCCINPRILDEQRNRSNINTTTTNQNNNNTNNNENNTNNRVNTNTSENTNNNNSGSGNNININNRTSSRTGRYTEPRPPIPSPKHQEPDAENHIIKNMGIDGFLGVFNEFSRINKVIGGLSSELLNIHLSNTEVLTPKKFAEIQNKSFYDLKRLIPILDRTGRIYSDISTFIEHSIRTNQLQLISKNLFSDVNRINEDLKFFSPNEKLRATNEILAKNSRRENRSGTVNLVPPVNTFDTKLKYPIPLIDTPLMTGRSESQIPQIFDFLIQNNNNSNEEELAVSGEDNNRSSENQNNNNRNYFLRNNSIESFNIRLEGRSENKKEEENKKNGIKKSKSKNKKNKNGYKILGKKTKRNKSNNKIEIPPDDEKNQKKKKKG